jgi:hypothetical protein
MDERGDGAVAYIVVITLFGLLVLQPSVIVAAVDRLSMLLGLLGSQIGYAF